MRNLKANHSEAQVLVAELTAVLARVKVRNLKANHSGVASNEPRPPAVLASVKVRNLKANHSHALRPLRVCEGCISKCEGTKSES